MDDISAQIEGAVQTAVSDQADQDALAASVQRAQLQRQSDADQDALRARLAELESAQQRMSGDNGIQYDQGLITPIRPSGSSSNISGNTRSIWIVSGGTMQLITIYTA